REIRAFTAEEYWTVEARLEGGAPPPFVARLAEVAGQKLDHKQLRLDTRARVDEVLARLGGAPWTVTKVERKERRRHPTPPFITSRLQQEASRKLGYQPSRTMRIAQRLYEGVDLGPDGSVGLITYMRTDSTRISGEALAAARDYVKARYGDPYVPETPNVYRSKKDAQDAHEAIRRAATTTSRARRKARGSCRRSPRVTCCASSSSSPSSTSRSRRPASRRRRSSRSWRRTASAARPRTPRSSARSSTRSTSSRTSRSA